MNTIAILVIVFTILFILYKVKFENRYHIIDFDDGLMDEYGKRYCRILYSDKLKPGLQEEIIKTYNFNSYLAHKHIKSLNAYERNMKLQKYFNRK